MNEPTDNPNAIQPQPVPTQFTTGTLPTVDGRSWVVLQVETPVGVAMYFLEPGAAVAVGNALRNEGKKGVGSKLAVPPNGLVVPGQ